MRYTGPVRFSHHGDKEVAQQYNVIARNLLGMMAAASQQPFSTRSVVLSNGVRITVEIIAQPVAPDRNWAEDAVAMMWSGQYQVSAHIYAPPGIKLSPVVEVAQYQFSAIAFSDQGYEVVPIGEGFSLVSGAWAVVLFALHEDGTVTHVALPVCSSHTEVKPGEEDAWPFFDPDDYETSEEFYAAVVSSLFHKRYEVVHTTPSHVQVDGKLLHSPWMGRGKLPHNTFFSKCFSAARPAGAEDTYYRQSAANLSTLPGYVTPLGSTDRGYEDDLSIYRPAPTTSEEEPVKTSSFGGAPDADWYQSYSTARVTSTFGGLERRFGILIDASQTLYVWPVEAEGTANPEGSPYEGQQIKTSVANEYVQSEQLNFPANTKVYATPLRDAWPDGLDDLAYEATKYGWQPDSTGLKLCTVGYEEVEPPFGFYHEAHGEYGTNYTSVPLFYDPKADESLATAQPYRLPKPVVLVCEITITLFGAELNAFSISHSISTRETGGSNFYPVAAAFAAAGAYGDLDSDELVVAGFEGFVFDEPVTRTHESYPLTGSPLPYHYWLAPRPEAPVDYLTSAENNLFVTPYLKQFERGFTFEKMQPEGAPSVFREIVRQHTYEAKFSVFSGTDRVFSVTAHKQLPQESHTEFFTAQVAGMDLTQATFVFGLSLGGSRTDSSAETAKFFQRKGHAVYHRGNVLDRRSNMADRLDENLTAEVPLSVDYANLSLLGFYPSVRNLQSPYLFGSYVQAVRDELGVVVNSARIAFDAFPLGLEMYAHMSANLFTADSFLCQVVSNDQFVSVAWWYLEPSVNEWDVNYWTNELETEFSAERVEVDFVSYAGTPFSHSDFFEEAFGRSIGKTTDAETLVDAVGEYVRERPGSDPDETYDVFRNYLSLYEGQFFLNMDYSYFWLYCGGPLNTSNQPYAAAEAGYYSDWTVSGKLLPYIGSRTYGILEAPDGD